jgi:putative Ca2+/H+ antiporter (TMEM165/GDT1 family)
VFLGSFLALVAVSGLGAILGRALLTRVRLSTIRRFGGTLCLVLAAFSALQIVGVFSA